MEKVNKNFKQDEPQNTNTDRTALIDAFRELQRTIHELRKLLKNRGVIA